MRLKNFPQKCGHRVKRNGSSQLNMGKFEKNIGSSTWVNVEKDEYGLVHITYEDPIENHISDNKFDFEIIIRKEDNIVHNLKATKNNEYYLTITESKKITDQEGQFFFEKHKIFLYKEDFEKFVDGMNETIEFINACSKEIPVSSMNKVGNFQFENIEK